MKKVFFSLLTIAVLGFVANKANAQMKVGVFDIDYMVQAMPGFSAVDSMVQIYQRDSLGTEYQIMNNEYHRLDSTFKSDSAAKKPQAVLDYSSNQRQQIAMKLVYWQQYAQNKSDMKTQTLAQPLYEKVVDAYKKVLANKKYAVILKPQTYEAGFPIDNIFIAVAKELKLTELPQQLIVLGDDPDAAAAAKPARRNQTCHRCCKAKAISNYYIKFMIYKPHSISAAFFMPHKINAKFKQTFEFLTKSRLPLLTPFINHTISCNRFSLPTALLKKAVVFCKKEFK